MGKGQQADFIWLDVSARWSRADAELTMLKLIWAGMLSASTKITFKYLEYRDNSRCQKQANI